MRVRYAVKVKQLTLLLSATAPETATSPDKVQNDRAALLDAREQIQRLTLELKTQKSTTEEALDESKRSSARFDELSRRYIKLEDELLASRGGGATSESARIIVILHGTMNIASLPHNAARLLMMTV